MMIFSTRALALPLVVMGLLITGCSSGDRAAGPLGRTPLDEWVVTLVFEGTADRLVSEDTWDFTIEEVMLQDDVVETTDGRKLLVAPRAAGDTISVELPDDRVKSGVTYVVVGAQKYLGDPESVEAVRALFDAGTMKPVISGPPDLEALAPADATPAVLKATLVAYLSEADDYNDAVRTGASSPPVGDFLARAWRLRGQPLDAAAESDRRDLEAYLATTPDMRQLEQIDDLPDGAAAALGLRDFSALVVWVSGEIESLHDAIGFRTDEGYVGPQMIESGRRFTEVVGAIPLGGSIELVGWKVPLNAPFDPASAVPIPFAGMVDLSGDGEVLFVDIASSHVDWISHDEARTRVEALLASEG